MKGRRVGEGGDMTGKSPTGRGGLFLGKEAFWRGDCMSVFLAFFSGVEEFGFGVFW
jgi:hypothetical protein